MITFRGPWAARAPPYLQVQRLPRPVAQHQSASMYGEKKRKRKKESERTPHAEPRIRILGVATLPVLDL